MMNYLKIFSGCLFWFLFFILGNTGAAQAPIVLERADSLTTRGDVHNSIRYLDGNVWITQDTLSVTCEHAVYEEAIGRLFFEEDVYFVEPSRKIWADQATYYERTGRAIADGNVRIEQDSIHITCNRVIYSEAREEALFFGDVQIHSLTDNAVLTGNHGAYNRVQDHGVMTQDPRMVRYLGDGDSMVVVGVVIEYFFEEEHVVVTDSVHISRSDFDGRGQKLHFWDAEERARLTGDPVLQHQRDVLTADTVNAIFEDQQLRRVILTGHAVATSPADSLALEPKNRMTGRTIEISFLDGELDSIHVKGNATSVYYIREEGEKKGANRVSGDVIDMWINEGRIRWIYVEGGTEGVYFPRHLENRVGETGSEIRPEQRRP